MRGKVHKIYQRMITNSGEGRKPYAIVLCGNIIWLNERMTDDWREVTCFHCLKGRPK